MMVCRSLIACPRQHDKELGRKFRSMLKNVKGTWHKLLLLKFKRGKFVTGACIYTYIRRTPT